MSEGNGNSKGDKPVAKQRNGNGKPKKPGGATGKGFMPGKSGNPRGRVPGYESLGTMVRKFADQVHPKDKQGRKRLDVLIERLYDEDPKTWLAYGYGKPVEMIQLSGAEGQPVEFRIAVTGAELP